MTLTKTSTYKEFQTTNFYSEMINYLTTTAMPHREPFTDQQAENMMNEFYWRSYWGESLEGID